MQIEWSKKEINIMKNLSKVQKLINMIFIFSGIMMTGLLSLRGSIPFILFGILCSATVLYILAFRFSYVKKTLQQLDKAQIIISVVFSLVADANFAIRFYENSFGIIMNLCSKINIPISYQGLIAKLILAIACVLALFTIFIFFINFFNKFFITVGRLIRSFDKLERWYIIITSVLSIFIVILVFSKTNVFYGATLDGKTAIYNVIFTSDSAGQVTSNVYLNINAGENDIRQPLFGLFAMPFAIFAQIMSVVLFFVPNIYPMIMNIIQVVLLHITFLLVAKMMKLDSTNKVLFLLIINVSYPSLLFSLNMEQYVFAVFWMILLVHAYVFNYENKEYYFIGATGSLLTSGILFPLLSYSRTIKDWLSDIAATCIKFFIIVTIFGQLPLILNSVDSIKTLLQYAGTKLTFHDKLYQYISFVSSCFFKPNAGVDILRYNYVSYQLYPVTTINTVGIILICIAFIGYLLNYGDAYTRICFWWITFSFILLCLIGWGTAENGLILYTLYFSWAFISLVFLAINKALEKFPTGRNLVYGILFIGLVLLNIPAIFAIIKFGIDNYPVLR